MRTTNEVVEAVKNGEPVTELELKCALITFHSYRMSYIFFDLARFCVEIDKPEGLSAKTIRGLKRAWEAQENFNKDLEQWILNSSMSPLLSKDEQRAKFAEHTAKTAVRLVEVLSGGKK